MDFSCGANEFVPLFKRYCLTRGKGLQGIAFDILTPMDMTDFRKSSWFDVPVGTFSACDPPANYISLHHCRGIEILHPQLTLQSAQHPLGKMNL